MGVFISSNFICTARNVELKSTIEKETNKKRKSQKAKTSKSKDQNALPSTVCKTSTLQISEPPTCLNFKPSEGPHHRWTWSTWNRTCKGAKSNARGGISCSLRHCSPR